MGLIPFFDYSSDVHARELQGTWLEVSGLKNRPAFYSRHPASLRSLDLKYWLLEANNVPTVASSNPSFIVLILIPDLANL